VARFPSDGGAGFLIGGFAQRKFEHQSKNTANNLKLKKIMNLKCNKGFTQHQSRLGGISAGFTLIELLVVIAIIGILSTLAFVSFSGVKEKAAIANGRRFSQSLQNSLGAYAVGWWSFNEINGGQVLDNSGYGHDGDVTNATLVASLDELGNALHFNGSSYLVIPGDLGDPEAMTIEFWFYIDTAHKAPVTRYLMDSRSDGGNWYFLQSYNPNGTGNLNFRNRVILNPEDWAADQWNHLAVSINVNGSAIYLNGGLKATGAGMNPNTGANLVIGKNYNLGGNGFFGDLDDLRIYETILSAKEIQQHYAEGLNKHTSS
jgi:prepilin-type N-terminal cleavage/methylation domain-containing protein